MRVMLIMALQRLSSHAITAHESRVTLPSMKILSADDDKDLLALIAFTLSQAGYLVVKASDGPSAIRAFEAEAPDLVILDINMPGASGFQVCEAIRAKSRVPVMMLTVRGEEEDLVRALELGADDYLTKPFSPRTLLARVKALLRRAGMENSAPLAAGRIRLDVEEHTVQVGGEFAGAAHQARAAAAANADRQRGPHRQLRSPADAGVGPQGIRRPATVEATRASPASQDRSGSGRPADAANRSRRGLQARRGVKANRPTGKPVNWPEHDWNETFCFLLLFRFWPSWPVARWPVSPVHHSAVTYLIPSFT